MKRALIVASVVGCGGGHAHAVDAMADTPPASDLVTVTVVDPEQSVATPLADATVVYIDASGVQEVMTDANGRAQALVAAGASVSTVRFSGGVAFITSVLDIKPGDAIALGTPKQDFGSPGTVIASFTATTDDYVVSDACGTTSGTSSPITVMLYNYCATNPLELVLEQTPSGTPLYSIASGIAFIAGENVAMPPVVAEPMYSSMVSGIPTGVTAAMSRTSDFVTHSAAIPAATTDTSVSFPGIVGSTAYFEGTFSDTANSTQSILFQAAPTSPQYNLDVSSSLLTWVGTPTVDANTGAITIPLTTDGTSGDSPDLAIAFLSSITSGSTSVEWTVYGPDPTMMTLPALPAALAVTGGTVMSGTAQLLELDAIDSYDTVRQSPDTALGLLTTATGRSRLSESPPAQ